MRDAFPAMSKTSANNRITRNEGILFILVESGAVLCAAQVSAYCPRRMLVDPSNVVRLRDSSACRHRQPLSGGLGA